MKLTAMQIAEAQKCNTPEEVVEKAKAQGIEMTLEEAKEVLAAPAIMELDDDDLAAVAGGCKTAGNEASVPCHKCDGTAIYKKTIVAHTKFHYYYCNKCGYTTRYEGDEYLDCYEIDW